MNETSLPLFPCFICKQTNKQERKKIMSNVLLSQNISAVQFTLSKNVRLLFYTGNLSYKNECEFHNIELKRTRRSSFRLHNIVPT